MRQLGGKSWLLRTILLALIAFLAITSIGIIVFSAQSSDKLEKVATQEETQITKVLGNSLPHFQKQGRGAYFALKRLFNFQKLGKVKK